MNAIRANVFDKKLEPETIVNSIGEFVIALRDCPHWAVMRALDTWTREKTYWPSPAAIRHLVSEELEPFRDEIRRREKTRALTSAAEAKPDPCSPEAAAEILARAGFTPRAMQALREAPTARSIEEAEFRVERATPHWTERAAPDGPEMQRLKAARDANPLVQAAREAQRRVEEAQDQQEQR